MMEQNTENSVQLKQRSRSPSLQEYLMTERFSSFRRRTRSALPKPARLSANAALPYPNRIPNHSLTIDANFCRHGYRTPSEITDLLRLPKLPASPLPHRHRQAHPHHHSLPQSTRTRRCSSRPQRTEQHKPRPRPATTRLQQCRPARPTIWNHRRAEPRNAQIIRRHHLRKRRRYQTPPPARPSDKTQHAPHLRPSPTTSLPNRLLRHQQHERLGAGPEEDGGCAALVVCGEYWV